MKNITFKNGKIYNPTKIIGVGRNYSEHIKEMRSEKTTDPVLFIKPVSALCDMMSPLLLPKKYGSVHHEIELAVCIGKSGSEIRIEDAFESVAGFGLALDLTLRDLQADAKKAGLPWAVAKGFNNSCPVSVFVPAEDIADVNNLNLLLKVNGEERQKGNTGQMLFKLDVLISYISRFFRLEEGDIILTGTPSGVGPLQEGDKIEATIDQIASIQTFIL
ncbi:MAG: fumarylacetoacetate hydrolase family protein [Calditrichaceae bacterium]